MRAATRLLAAGLLATGLLATGLLAAGLIAVGLGAGTPGRTGSALAAGDNELGPIAALQARLAGLGYDPGPRDGVMSAQTQQALLAYRRATGQSAGQGPMTDPVASAQEALQQLGFLAGPADGAIGPQTRDAIIRFEAARHLPIDPRVSDRLLAALAEAEAPAVAVSASQPPAPALPAAEPAVTGRQPLPAGVTPPPIH